MPKLEASSTGEGWVRQGRKDRSEVRISDGAGLWAEAREAVRNSGGQQNLRKLFPVEKDLFSRQETSAPVSHPARTKPSKEKLGLPMTLPVVYPV